MSRPVVSDAAERIYAQLGPWQAADESNGWIMLHACEGAARMVAKANDVLRADDVGSGLRRLFSPSRASAWTLPWLAQPAGIGDLPPGLTETEQRTMVHDAPGWRRGTVASMVAHIAATLTGARTVRIVERVDGDAGRIAVITAPAETPDPAVTRAAALASKPTRPVLETYMTAAPLLMEYTRQLSGVTATLAAATLVDVT